MPIDPSLRSLIATFRRSPNWDADLDLELLQKLWPLVAGEALSAATQVVAIQGSTAIINVPNAIWRRQLVQMKWQLLRKINELWESKRIVEIAFTHEDH